MSEKILKTKKADTTIVGVIENSTLKTITKSGTTYNEGRLVINVSDDPVYGSFESMAITVEGQDLKFVGMHGVKIEAKVFNRTFSVKNNATGRVKDFHNEMRAIKVKRLPL